METPAEVRLWRFEVTDQLTGKRRETRYRLTEAEALERYGPTATKVPGSELVVTPGRHTSDFQRGA